MMNSVKGKLTTDDDMGNSFSVPIFSKFSNCGILPLRGGLGHSVLLTPKMRKCNMFPTVGPQKRSFSKTQLFTELLIDGGHITVAQVYPESYYAQWLGHYCQHSKSFSEERKSFLFTFWGFLWILTI